MIRASSGPNVVASPLGAAVASARAGRASLTRYGKRPAEHMSASVGVVPSDGSLSGAGLTHYEPLTLAGFAARP